MTDRNDYAVRIERVVRYLCEHLDERLELDVLARVACFSRYHFHRIYRSIQGETAADTVRRLRLNRAAIELLEADSPIERIARRAGYSSRAAFSRAFRAAYGMPPGSYQGQTGLIARHNPPEPRTYPVEIVDSPPLLLAAISHRGNYHQITQTFDILVSRVRSLGRLGPSARYLGIYYDDPHSVEESELRAEACVSTAEPLSEQPLAEQSLIEPAGIHALEIAAGRYAQVIHIGAYSELEHPYTWLYRTWLPSTGVETADLPCVEEYLNDPRSVPPSELRTAIWLPIT